jgi:pimeloyl-ACP methyl ester carboxylesterase
MRVVFVHGACVTDAAWWWHRMIEPLADAGMSTTAVELPSCDPERLGDLHDDADAVRAVLRSDDEPTVLCAHSYGGMVITEAAVDQPNVRQLVYITSMLPDHGESLAGLTDPDAPQWLEPADGGTVALKADLSDDDIRTHFLNDCDDGATTGAMARLSRQSAAVFAQSPRDIAWRTIPSTYVLCTDDRATVPARQKTFSHRADHVVELKAGHHPFLSRPDPLARMIVEAAHRS